MSPLKTAYLGQPLVVLLLAVGEYDVAQVLVGLAEQLLDAALLGPVDHVLLVQHQDVRQVAGEAIPARKRQCEKLSIWSQLCGLSFNYAMFDNNIDVIQGQFF